VGFGLLLVLFLLRLARFVPQSGDLLGQLAEIRVRVRFLDIGAVVLSEENVGRWCLLLTGLLLAALLAALFGALALLAALAGFLRTTAFGLGFGGLGLVALRLFGGSFLAFVAHF